MPTRRSNRVQLPLVQCKRTAELTPARIAAILAAIEATWKKLARRRDASPTLSMDAYLAAFAIVAGVQLVTIDAAFRQFPGLDVRVIERE